MSIAERADLLRSILDSSVDCIKVIERDGTLSFMNANGLCAMEIDHPQSVLGRPWRELWPKDAGEQLNEAIAAGLNGEPTRFEAYCPTAKGTPRWWDVTVSPLREASGEVSRLVAVSRDVSDRIEVETKLRDSETRFHAIVNSIDQMIWSTRPDGYHDFYNDRWYEFTGVPAGSTDGEAWNGMFHPDDQERAWAVWRHSLLTGDPYHIEYRLRHRSGEYRWVIGRAQCVRDEEGAIVRWYGTCTDIHDLKEAEEQRELIARELSHRIKNIFAVILSLLTLSTRNRPDLRPVMQEVEQRIAALSAAHEYVRPHSPDSAAPDEHRTLQGLLLLLLAPYDDGHQRILVDGCDLPIGAHAATSIALLFHELATNAAKYGALSHPDGTVSVSCERRGDRLQVTWREHGGPPVSGTPEHRGFGTQLADRVVAGQLDARLSRNWLQTGVEVTVDLSVDRLA
ncbi:MAG: PAS domain-containing protein [Sphingomonadaceae bacterium]|nr:PAS domain-containing protein [Sphingomonadaceae bacterium]